jgi:hypothetical protein
LAAVFLTCVVCCENETIHPQPVKLQSLLGDELMQRQQCLQAQGPYQEGNKSPADNRKGSHTQVDVAAKLPEAACSMPQLADDMGT